MSDNNQRETHVPWKNKIADIETNQQCPKCRKLMIVMKKFDGVWTSLYLKCPKCDYEVHK